MTAAVFPRSTWVHVWCFTVMFSTRGLQCFHLQVSHSTLVGEHRRRRSQEVCSQKECLPKTSELTERVDRTQDLNLSSSLTLLFLLHRSNCVFLKNSKRKQNHRVSFWVLSCMCLVSFSSACPVLDQFRVMLFVEAVCCYSASLFIY